MSVDIDEPLDFQVVREGDSGELNNSLLGKCAAVDIDTVVQLTYEMVRKIR